MENIGKKEFFGSLLDELSALNLIIQGKDHELKNAFIPDDYQNLVSLKNFYNEPNFLDKFLSSSEGVSSLNHPPNA